MPSGTEHLRKAEIILAECEAQVKPGTYNMSDMLLFAQIHTLIAVARKLDQLAAKEDK